MTALSIFEYILELTNSSPQCLPDMLEAYLAAIFVDSDFDFAVVEEFFHAHIKPYFEDMSLYDTFANRHPSVGPPSPMSLEQGVC